MAHFTYTATKSTGEPYSGSAEAADRFELYQAIRREGGHLISVKEEVENKWLTLDYWNLLVARVGEYDKILLARNLGAMLAAGLSLTRALAVIERQSKNAKLKYVVSQIAEEVRRGDNFNTALSKFPGVFSPIFIAMVRAGEEGGDLTGSLATVADQMERIHDLKKKIRGAMIYPSIVLIAMIGISFLMMTEVVPTLAQTFEEMNAKLPTSTQIVVGISNALQHYTLYVLIGAIAFGAGIYGILRTRQGRRGYEWILLHMPIINTLVREVNAARTARTLASLLSAGVDVITALSISSEIVQNSYFRDVIDDATKAVRAGEPLSTTFARNEDLYPAFVGEMMMVGEETGATADMLKRLALYYEMEVDRKTKDMSTIIEPFLTLLIGGGVGFFAVSMITPIYQMTEKIG
ncbi:type II secretion system F family protein [Candidatus Kaiserbacteria bacterium]|nr:type II secretion system F family protein [Candidatus Kaiserbacteria bacterium]